MKYLICFVNGILLLLAVYLGADVAESWISRPHGTLSQKMGKPAGQPEKEAPSPDPLEKNNHAHDNAVLTRNLFQVSTGSPVKPGTVSSVPLERTQLALRLRGTMAGSGRAQSFAVIEGGGPIGQSLYATGDTVGGAKILRIGRNQLVLQYQGREELLETRPEAVSGPSHSTGPSPAHVPEPAALARIKKTVPKTLAQFKRFAARGKSKGLLVHGINPDSGFARAGIKNGDVVTHVNDNLLSQPSDAGVIHEALNENESVTLSILRRGAARTIIYDPQTGDGSLVPPTKAAPQEQ